MSNFKRTAKVKILVDIYCQRETNEERIQNFVKKHKSTACAFDIRLYLTPLGQARQFEETCGT